MWPYHCWRATSTGSLTPCLLQLAALLTWPLLHLRRMDSSRKLPRRLRSRRRRGKQSASLANENSASRVADPATPLGPSANENSASSAVTRPRSTANRNSSFPGPQPGTSRSLRSALMKHPQTFQPSQPSQHPKSTTNENAERQPHLDHPEIWVVYKPPQHSIRQDTLTSIHWDSFSGSGLSSPVLQRPHQDSFSESPSGQLNKKSLIQEKRESLEDRGQVLSTRCRDPLVQTCG